MFSNFSMASDKKRITNIHTKRMGNHKATKNPIRDHTGRTPRARPTYHQPSQIQYHTILLCPRFESCGEAPAAPIKNSETTSPAEILLNDLKALEKLKKSTVFLQKHYIFFGILGYLNTLEFWGEALAAPPKFF